MAKEGDRNISYFHASHKQEKKESDTPTAERGWELVQQHGGNERGSGGQVQAAVYIKPPH